MQQKKQYNRRAPHDDGGPIAVLGVDMCVNILSRLSPVSVVAFAAASKACRDVAHSESVWECLCQKAWNLDSDFKTRVLLWNSASESNRLVWRALFQRVAALDKATWISLDFSHMPSYQEHPAGRASLSLCLLPPVTEQGGVKECVLMFGGGSYGGEWPRCAASDKLTMYHGHDDASSRTDKCFPASYATLVGCPMYKFQNAIPNIVCLNLATDDQIARRMRRQIHINTVDGRARQQHGTAHLFITAIYVNSRTPFLLGIST